MHLRPTSRAAIAACAAAAVCAAAPTAASAATGTSTLTLSSKTLRSAGVKVQAVKPATLKGTKLTLPTTGVTLTGSAVVRHGGAIRFVKGKRKVTFTGLRTSLGTAPAITATVNRKRLTLFTLKGGSIPHFDGTTGSATTTGTTLGLSSSAAKAIKSGLRLRRLAAGNVGRASVTGTDPAAAAAPKQPAPTAPTAPATPPAATAPGTPAPPAPKPTPEPEPEPVQPSLGITRWVSSTLPSDNDHRSWINYVTSICGGTVKGSEGMAPLAAGNRFDFTVEQVAGTPASLTHQGRIQYTCALHGIQQWMDDLTFVDLDQPTGRVLADGFSKGSFMNPDAPDTTYEDRHVLDLDLDGPGVTVTTDPLTRAKTFTNVPAAVSPNAGEAISYEAGRPWGFFTFTVPAAPIP